MLFPGGLRGLRYHLRYLLGLRVAVLRFVNSASQKVSTPDGQLPQKYGEGRFYLAAFSSELYTAEKLSVSECNERLQ
jgi:hypothetical protein